MIAKTYYVKARFMENGLQHEYISEYVYRRWNNQEDSVTLRKIWFKSDGEQYRIREKKIVHQSHVLMENGAGHDLFTFHDLHERLVFELGRALPGKPVENDYSHLPF